MGYQAATDAMAPKEKREWQDIRGGLKREAGTSGKDADHRNWKQCVWRSADGRDIGLIKVCWI